MTIYRVVLEEGGADVPKAYKDINGRAFVTVELAEGAVIEAYSRVYREIPDRPGATVGPTHEREFFSKTVRFPLVSIRGETVTEK